MKEKYLALQEVVESGKKKTQNTSLEKYEILWDYEETLRRTPQETRGSLQGKFLTLLVKEIIAQDPAPPLRRVVANWIVGICSVSGAVSQALLALKSFQGLLNQKAPLSAKLAAIECCGMIFEGLGTLVASQATDLVTLLMKQFKSSSIEKRVASLVAIQRVVEGTGTSGLHLHSGIYKQLKQLTAEKETQVRGAVANLLLAMASYCTLGNTELFLSIVLKLSEDGALSVRSASSNALGTCLAQQYEKSSSVTKKKESNPSGSQVRDWTVYASLEFLGSIFLRGVSSSSKRELRAGITEAVVTYLNNLPTRVLKSEMSTIIDRILSLLTNQAMKNYATLPELLQAHLCISHMLNDGLRSHLGEEGQKRMANELVRVLATDGYNDYILILTLRQLSYLLLDLGQGAEPLWDGVEQPLAKLLFHQSYSVRSMCAITARSLATALPDRLAKLLGSFLNVTNHQYAELATCKPNQLKHHLGPLQGNAYAVAGLISIIPRTPLGVPNTVTKFALKTAKTLIRIDPSCKYDAVLVARAESGWSIISALMKLGPTFVEPKLADILDMWETSFKIDSARPRTTEKSVVVFCRLKSCALEALCNFLRNNHPLLGDDIIERAVMWLENIRTSTSKLSKLPSTPQTSTVDTINILKANIVKTYAALPVPSYSSNYVTLMTWLIHELPRNATNSLFRSLLNENDSILGPWLVGKDLREARLTQSPNVVVNDHSVIWSSDPEKELTNPIPTAKKFVNEILELFPQLYVVQSEEHQKTIILHFIKCIREAPPEWKNSLQSNVFCLLLKTCQALAAKKRSFPKALLPPLLEFIESYLSTPEASLRRAAAESIGFLAVIQGEQFTEKVVNTIAETLKVSKDSTTRAGCVFSLGCVIRCLGGMKSTHYLPVTVSILHVLAKDPSTVTHVWALHSLWLTIETTSLSFAPFASPTLSLVFSLLLSKFCTTNSGYQCIGRVVNSCISCVGPELRADSETFRTCCAIISELQANPHPMVQLESIHFQQMLALFAPQTLKPSESLPILRGHLQSKFPSLRRASVICLRQLVQIDAHGVETAGEGFTEQLLQMMDQEKDVDLRNEMQPLITSLIEYLAPNKVGHFLEIFKTVIAASGAQGSAGAPQKLDEPNPEDDRASDEEDSEEIDDSGQLTVSPDASSDDGVFVPRWRTRVFCMESIGKLIEVVQASKIPEHFDLIAALRWISRVRAQTPEQAETSGLEETDFLVFHLQDLVTVSFNCSTSSIGGLRPVGVKVLQEIVECFANAQDPHYEGHKLLELYSAQVAAALRPAFERDCSPLLTAAAADVVVSFVRKNISADVASLQKVTRLLTSFIETVESVQYPSFSERASTMVQLKVLGATAQLYCSTLAQDGSGTSNAGILKELIEPVMGTLRKLWMLVLRDWCILSTQGAPIQKAYKGAFYMFSSVAFVMEYYKEVWGNILLAEASLIQTPHWVSENASSEEKKAALEDFLLMFGLCYKSLVDSHETDELVISLTSCAYLCSSPYLHPNYLPLQQLQELLNVLQLHSFIGNGTVRMRVIRVMRKLIAHLPEEYFDQSDLSNEALHRIIEIISAPLHENILESPEAILLAIESISLLPRLSGSQPTLLEKYAPVISLLLLKIIYQAPFSLLQPILSALTCLLQPLPSSNILFASISSILTMLEKQPPTVNSMMGLLSLMVVALPKDAPPALHEGCAEMIEAVIVGPDVQVKEQLLKALLSWLQTALQPEQPPQVLKMLHWYMQHVCGAVLVYLRTRGNHPSEESCILDSIKLLVLSHSLVAENQKSTMLSLVIPTLILFLDTSKSSMVSDFALQVVQTLAGTSPTTFKQLADNLPQNLRSLLENAAERQQKQASMQQAAAQAGRRSRTKQTKALTLDFAEYD